MKLENSNSFSTFVRNLTQLVQKVILLQPLFMEQKFVILSNFFSFFVAAAAAAAPARECWKQEKIKEDGFWSHLRLPAVTLFSFLHVAVAALLAPVEHFDLGHVVQTHADTFLQTGSQVLLTARAEHSREGVPGK